jgi:hypothetical protein
MWENTLTAITPQESSNMSANLNPIFERLLQDFQDTMVPKPPPPENEKPPHDVDKCAGELFPRCGVCISFLDEDAERLVFVLSHPNAPRA